MFHPANINQTGCVQKELCIGIVIYYIYLSHTDGQ